MTIELLRWQLSKLFSFYNVALQVIPFVLNSEHFLMSVPYFSFNSDTLISDSLVIPPILVVQVHFLSQEVRAETKTTAAAIANTFFIILFWIFRGAKLQVFLQKLHFLILFMKEFYSASSLPSSTVSMISTKSFLVGSPIILRGRSLALINRRDGMLRMSNICAMSLL